MTKTRVWLQGAGLAMLYLLPLIATFLSSSQNGFYHQVMPVTSLTRGVLLDLLLMTLILGAGFVWLRSLKPKIAWRLLWLSALLVTAFVAERGLAGLLGNINVSVPAWLRHSPWIVLAAAVLLLLFARRYYDVVIHATEVFLMLAGIATLFVVLPQLVYACFNHAPLEQGSFARAPRQSWRPGEPRVVWILFDELSQDQVFDHRQPGIDLPAFTRLKQESVSFSQLVPFSNYTEMVIPSLLQGRPISAIKSNRSGELLWQSAAQEGWQQFDPHATLFAAAQLRGWGTGVAGWYNPYCRLLAPVLDRCYWTYHDFSGGLRFDRLTSEQGTLQNARDALPFVPQIENALEHTNFTQSHKSDFQHVLRQANWMIEDTNIRFAFIHLPVPHPPGIYPDPVGGGGGDYLGNLILADQTLTQLRAAIAKTAAAADTILIVSSDHSWRVRTWSKVPGWTQAEERASNGGQFDPRPVLLVHFPGQTQQNAQSMDRPESPMVVHSLLLDIFAGRIRTVDDLNNAVAAEPVAAGT
jgi:hypothetical protein